MLVAGAGAGAGPCVSQGAGAASASDGPPSLAAAVPAAAAVGLQLQSLQNSGAMALFHRQAFDVHAAKASRLLRELPMTLFQLCRLLLQLPQRLSSRARHDNGAMSLDGTRCRTSSRVLAQNSAVLRSLFIYLKI